MYHGVYYDQLIQVSFYEEARMKYLVRVNSIAVQNDLRKCKKINYKRNSKNNSAQYAPHLMCQFTFVRLTLDIELQEFY